MHLTRSFLFVFCSALILVACGSGGSSAGGGSTGGHVQVRGSKAFKQRVTEAFAYVQPSFYEWTTNVREGNLPGHAAEPRADGTIIFDMSHATSHDPRWYAGLLCHESAHIAYLDQTDNASWGSEADARACQVQCVDGDAEHLSRIQRFGVGTCPW